MTDYDNTNRGTLFRNDERKHDRSPEYSGSLNVDGVEYWLNGWVQESKKSRRRFFSLTVRAKDEAEQKPQQKTQRQAPPAPDFDSELPF